MTIPDISANTLIFVFAFTLTVMFGVLVKPYFSNGESGPTGTLNQRAHVSLTLLNSITLLFILWLGVFAANKVASIFDRFADYVERQEAQEKADARASGRTE